MATAIDFSVNSKAASSMLEGIAKRGGDLRPAMILVKAILAKGLAKNVATKGRYFGTPWPALSPATLARKARQGDPSETLNASGRLLQALLGGSGRRTRVSRTRVSVGVSGDFFEALFTQAGASKGRRGNQPARPVLGITETEQQAAVAVLQRYLEHGLA